MLGYDINRKTSIYPNPLFASRSMDNAGGYGCVIFNKPRIRYRKSLILILFSLLWSEGLLKII